MFTLDEDENETEFGESFKIANKGRGVKLESNSSPTKIEYIPQLDPSGSSSDDAFTPEE